MYMYGVCTVHVFYIMCVGTDGGLDFGTLRVHDELRLTMQVKNRGKYDIAYK